MSLSGRVALFLVVVVMGVLGVIVVGQQARDPDHHCAPGMFEVDRGDGIPPLCWLPT